VVAESCPQAPGRHCANDQTTPLLCASLTTVAEKLCVCPGCRVEAAGEVATDTEFWGAGEGVTTGGGSPAGAGECELEFGIEAQPPIPKEVMRQRTARATGARAATRTPGSEFKVPFLQWFPEQYSVVGRFNCRDRYRARNMAVY
jgi:hypothetical protein